MIGLNKFSIANLSLKQIKMTEYSVIFSMLKKSLAALNS